MHNGQELPLATGSNSATKLLAEDNPTQACDSVIEELERQHLSGNQKFEVLRRQLRAFSNAETGNAQAFAACVDDFAEDQWRHMRVEEDLVLPAASRYLPS